MDIIGARNISFEDVKRLNPGMNLGTFNNGEKLKLPPGKYTVREKEMLQGCGILPPETVNPFKVGGARGKWAEGHQGHCLTVFSLPFTASQLSSRKKKHEKRLLCAISVTRRRASTSSI